MPDYVEKVNNQPDYSLFALQHVIAGQGAFPRNRRPSCCCAAH